jgi:methionyl-tRNA formyltransferase
LRVAFAGTPEFARVALQGLHQAGFEIALVLTQPDRPAGRGMKLQASPVKQYAVENNLPLAQPAGLKLDGNFAQDAAQAQAALFAAKVEVMVVAAYGLILPAWVLSLPPLGCINIHASLLPRWRGAAPIHRAIEAGDAQTGVTLMQMDAGLDTGDMLAVQALPISTQDTTASLHDKLAQLGARLVVDGLPLAAQGALQARVQPTQGVSYAHKIERSEAQIDWTLSAQVIERRIRAFNPFPVATMLLQGQVIKIWRSEIESLNHNSGKDPGTILAADSAGMVVQSGQGGLRLHELQRAGGKRLAVGEFLRGFDLAPCEVLR